ncbi:MAG: diguanylate cyclase [Burkholderiales bacterium]
MLNLLETITEQISAQSLPLVAITVAAVPCPDTPLILTLHWHGFIEEKICEIEEATTVAYTAIPSSALQINRRWSDLAIVDRAAMEAGWELGAWDVARAERPGCIRPGAASRETLECLQAFGTFPFGPGGDSQAVVAEAPDIAELINLAAHRGYLMWMFRPVHRGIWAEFADDATLDANGTRTPPCPIEPVPPAAQGPARTVYRFGIPSSVPLAH